MFLLKLYLNITLNSFSVGAGTAGSVLANRLTANYKYTVLVLEDGGDPSPFSVVPALFFNNLFQPSTDYAYDIVEQPQACVTTRMVNATSYNVL